MQDQFQGELIAPLAGVLKLDQVAFAARTDEDEKAIKAQLRLTNAEWVEDIVEAEGYVSGEHRIGRQNDELDRNVAKLQFCYAYGMEIEILRYIEGHNYLDAQGIKSGTIAHLGFHIEKGKQTPTWMYGREFEGRLAQKVLTKSHTNEYLLQRGRTYEYTIYDTRWLFGANLKVIRRIEGGVKE